MAPVVKARTTPGSSTRPPAAAVVEGGPNTSSQSHERETIDVDGLLVRFEKYMRDKGVSPATARGYPGLVKAMHQQHQRPLAIMVNDEFLAFIKKQPCNVKGHGNYVAALRHLREFLALEFKKECDAPALLTTQKSAPPKVQAVAPKEAAPAAAAPKEAAPAAAAPKEAAPAAPARTAGEAPAPGAVVLDSDDDAEMRPSRKAAVAATTSKPQQASPAPPQKQPSMIQGAPAVAAKPKPHAHALTEALSKGAAQMLPLQPRKVTAEETKGAPAVAAQPKPQAHALTEAFSKGAAQTLMLQPRKATAEETKGAPAVAAQPKPQAHALTEALSKGAAQMLPLQPRKATAEETKGAPVVAAQPKPQAHALTEALSKGAAQTLMLQPRKATAEETKGAPAVAAQPKPQAHALTEALSKCSAQTPPLQPRKATAEETKATLVTAGAAAASQPKLQALARAASPSQGAAQPPPPQPKKATAEEAPAVTTGAAAAAPQPKPQALSRTAAPSQAVAQPPPPQPKEEALVVTEGAAETAQPRAQASSAEAQASSAEPQSEDVTAEGREAAAASSRARAPAYADVPTSILRTITAQQKAAQAESGATESQLKTQLAALAAELEATRQTLKETRGQVAMMDEKLQEQLRGAEATTAGVSETTEIAGKESPVEAPALAAAASSPRTQAHAPTEAADRAVAQAPLPQPAATAAEESKELPAVTPAPAAEASSPRPQAHAPSEEAGRVTTQPSAPQPKAKAAEESPVGVPRPAAPASRPPAQAPTEAPGRVVAQPPPQPTAKAAEEPKVGEVAPVASPPSGAAAAVAAVAAVAQTTAPVAPLKTMPTAAAKVCDAAPVASPPSGAAAAVAEVATATQTTPAPPEQPPTATAQVCESAPVVSPPSGATAAMAEVAAATQKAPQAPLKTLLTASAKVSESASGAPAAKGEPAEAAEAATTPQKKPQTLQKMFAAASALVPAAGEAARTPDAAMEAEAPPGEATAAAGSAAAEEGRSGPTSEAPAAGDAATQQELAAAPHGGEEGVCEVGGEDEDEAEAKPRPAKKAKVVKQLKMVLATSGTRRHNLKSLMQLLKVRYRDGPPRRCPNLFDNPEMRQEHEDAQLLDIVRLRAMKSVLTEAEMATVRTVPWGDEALRSWMAEGKAAQKKSLLDAEASDAEDQDQDPPADDQDAQEEDVGAAEDGEQQQQQVKEKKSIREEKERVWAAVHTVRRIGEQWKTRPRQRWVEARAPDVEDSVLSEHKDSLAVKTLQKFYVEGLLHPDVHDALLRLPSEWSFDALLNWQCMICNKMRKIADTYPDEVPAHALGTEQVDDVLDPAKWIRDFQGCVIRRMSGLSEHVAEELRAWVRWGGPQLDTWLEVRRQKDEKSAALAAAASGRRPRPPSSGVQKEKSFSSWERLGTVLNAYKEAAPMARVFASSEEERQEKFDAHFLERIERLHFRGAWSSEDILAVADDAGATWFRELVVGHWEKNKAEGIDPEEVRMAQRLKDIGERWPAAPPSQVGGRYRDRWEMTKAMQCRHADAWFLRCLKDLFFANGLSQAVLDAMRNIPSWGAPRLEEWTFQRETRAAQLFERSSRTSRTKKEQQQQQQDADEGQEGEEQGEPQNAVDVASILRELRDTDRLATSRKEPRHHRIRLRVTSCHGKTVAEALKTVHDGVLKLTRRTIASDIALGLLVLQTDDAEPRTPSKPVTARVASAKKFARKRPREESFRDLTGKIVTLQAQAPGCKKARGDGATDGQPQLPPLSSLGPGDVEQLAADQLAYYEKQLGWTARRKNTERIDNLEQNLQTNTLTGGAAPVATFTEMSAYARLQLRGDELKHFEQTGMLMDAHEVSLQERRNRLKEFIWQVEEKQAREAPKNVQLFMRHWTSASTGAKGTWKKGEVFSLDEED